MIKQNKYLTQLLIKLIISSLLVLILIGCSSTGMKQDISKVDFVSKDLSSPQISVEGISLGMSLDEVHSVRGYPSDVDDLGEVINYYYAKEGKTEFFVHFVNGTVNRISVFESYNDSLIGESKLFRNKNQIYADFGIANEFIDQGRTRRFIYNLKGYEIFIRSGDHIGYSFFNPIQDSGEHKTVITDLFEQNLTNESN